MINLKQAWKNAKHWPGRFVSFQDDPAFFLFCYWVRYFPLSAHSALKSCANVPHKGLLHHIKEVTDATKVIIAIGLNLPSLSSGYENFALVVEFGSGSFPFLLLPWLLVWQIPAVALPIPTQTGGERVGWEGELRNFGLAPLAHQGSQAARRGTQSEPSTMLTRIASFGKEETQEPQLKRCFAVGITQLYTACCP